MTAGHFRNECKHGVVVNQCRCPGPNKTVTVVPCPPTCKAEAVTALQEPDKFYLACNPRRWQRMHLIRRFSLIRGGLLVPIPAKCGRAISPTEISRDKRTLKEWMAMETRLCAKCSRRNP